MRTRAVGREAAMENGEKYSDDRTKIALTKLKYDHDLATLGLQGTLWGSWASLGAIVIIVVAQVMTERYVLQGWPLAATVAVITLAVTFYGAFIFDRALSVSARVQSQGGASLSASSGGATSAPAGKGHGHGRRSSEIDNVG